MLRVLAAKLISMQSQQIKVGSSVKFTEELTPGENDFIMTVLEHNGDRCLIVTDLGWKALNPTQVVKTDTLTLR